MPSDDLTHKFLRFNLDHYANKIEAIKVVRKLFGWGLKDAKSWIEGECVARVTVSNADTIAHLLSTWGTTFQTQPDQLETGW